MAMTSWLYQGPLGITAAVLTRPTRAAATASFELQGGNGAERGYALLSRVFSVEQESVFITIHPLVGIPTRALRSFSHVSLGKYT
jgi:hypothetical protein